MKISTDLFNLQDTEKKEIDTKNIDINTKNKLEFKYENENVEQTLKFDNLIKNTMNTESVRTYVPPDTTSQIVENNTLNKTIILINQSDININSDDAENKNKGKKGFFSFLLGQSDYKEIPISINENPEFEILSSSTSPSLSSSSSSSNSSSSSSSSTPSSSSLQSSPPSSSSSSSFTTSTPLPHTHNTTSFHTTWVRDIRYSRSDNRKIFATPPQSEQLVFQIMNMKKTEIYREILLDDNSNKNNKNNDYNNKITKINENGSISVFKNSNITDSVTIISYYNISHLPFCSNSSIKVTYEFKNLNKNLNSNSDMNIEDENKSKKNKNKNNYHDIESVTDDKKTSFSVYLDVQCPPSMCRPFVVSSIKKEFKNFVKKFKILIEKTLNEKNDFREKEKFVTGNGEIEIIKFIERDFLKYKIKIEENLSHNDDNDKINNNKNLSKISDDENIIINNQYKIFNDKYDNDEIFSKKTDDEYFRKNSYNEFDFNMNSISHSAKYQNSPISSDFSVNLPKDEISAKFLRLRDHW